MYNNFEIKCLERHIYELEISLLKDEVRNSAKAVQNLLSSEFMEHCSSGVIYEYQVGDIFYDEMLVEYEMKDFQIKILEENTVLSIFNLKKNFIDDGKVVKSRRSSIWKREEDGWKMYFHQGTNYKD